MTNFFSEAKNLLKFDRIRGLILDESMLMAKDVKLDEYDYRLGEVMDYRSGEFYSEVD